MQKDWGKTYRLDQTGICSLQLISRCEDVWSSNRPASALLPAQVIYTIHQNLSEDMQFTSDSQILSSQTDIKLKVEM
jgi:hypothetical protein